MGAVAAPGGGGMAPGSEAPPLATPGGPPEPLDICACFIWAIAAACIWRMCLVWAAAAALAETPGGAPGGRIAAPLGAPDGAPGGGIVERT